MSQDMHTDRSDNKNNNDIKDLVQATEERSRIAEETAVAETKKCAAKAAKQKAIREGQYNEALKIAAKFLKDFGKLLLSGDGERVRCFLKLAGEDSRLVGEKLYNPAILICALESEHSYEEPALNPDYDSYSTSMFGNYDMKKGRIHQYDGKRTIRSQPFFAMDVKGKLFFLKASTENNVRTVFGEKLIDSQYSKKPALFSWDRNFAEARYFTTINLSTIEEATRFLGHLLIEDINGSRFAGKNINIERMKDNISFAFDRVEKGFKRLIEQLNPLLENQM